MRKCLKCNVVFHSDDRQRCLYCNALIMTVDEDNSPIQENMFAESDAIIEQVVRSKKLQTHDHIRYIVGSYFKTRTFQFMYKFSRNEFKIGRKYKRLLIQPLNMTSFLVLPWLIVDFIDSLFFRLFYQGYCEGCGWKFLKIFGGQESHSKEECDYNKEYTSLIKEILSGNICRTEKQFKNEAMHKIQQDERTAYNDLCREKHKYDAVVDVASIWFSIGLIVYLIVWVSLPISLEIVHSIKI